MNAEMIMGLVIISIVAVIMVIIGISQFNKNVVNGRFCPQSVRNFCPIVAGFNAGTYKVPACVL